MYPYGYIYLSEVVHLLHSWHKLTLWNKNGVYLYSSKNLKVLLKIQWIFVILLSVFVVIRSLRIHTHMPKCWRGTWSEKGCEPLFQLMFEFLSQMKIPNPCQRWGDVWLLPFRAKRIRCLVSLAHNGPGVFGAKWHFLASTICVKVFRSKFKAMRFQGWHWLQTLGSGKTSFGAKLV